MAEGLSDSLSSGAEEEPSKPSQNDLLVFKDTFDFMSYVKGNLTDNSIYGSFDNQELVNQSAKMVGQERNGNILLAWDAPTDNKTNKVVTHIGTYSTSSPSHRTVYSHNEQIDVCGATIDQEKCLLAFTIREKLPTGLTYDTYIAEIRPCNRVFSLNLLSPDFRKLQFIHDKNKQSSHSSKGKHIANLLVIIPENWACLYSFQLEPIEKGYTVINQPSQNVIVKNFPWYHWDPRHQWLTYAKFSVSHRKDNMLIIHVVDFNPKVPNVFLTFSLPLSQNIDHYTSTTTYYNSSLAFCLPVLELNMKVLHNDDGLWIVCLQHSDGRSYLSRSQKKSTRDIKLEYTVYIAHNGHMIDGEVVLPSSPDSGHYIQFMLLGNFVLAYVPGVMFHLLNIGTETDPCHHLVLNQEYAPSLPLPDENNHTPELTGRRILEDALSKDFNVDGSYTVFDPVTQIFYDCQLSSKALFDLFISTNDAQLKESLIHLMIVGQREHSYGLHMIEHVCQTPVSLEDPRLFHEFLLALTYSSVYPEFQRFFTRHIPLTISNCYRGNIYKTPAGKKYALLRCNEMIDFHKQLLVQSDQKLVSATPDTVLGFNPSHGDPVLQLSYNTLLNQSKIYRRLNLCEIASQVSTLALSTPTSSGSAKQGEKGSDSFGRSGNFVEKIKVFLYSSKPTTNSSVSSSPLPFLLPDEDLSESILIRSDLYRGRIVQVLSNQLQLQARNNQSQLHSVVKLYLAELKKTSQVLLHIIWSSLKFSNDNHPLQSSLHRQPSLEEEVLFELLESYHLVHVDIGLQPPTGFMTLFICMGYLCLEPSVFINYLRNNVFTPTKTFISLLLSDCDGVDDDFLFEILSHIDEEARLAAMKRWQHPVLDLWLKKLPSPKQN